MDASPYQNAPTNNDARAQAAGQGLYRPEFEHDACGVGFVAHIKGKKSHRIIEQGLQILCNLDHRGAVGADPLMGDGAGILTQIPDQFFREEMAAQGVQLPPAGEYGVGMVFLPKEHASRLACEQEVERAVRAEGQVLLGWRDVPVDRDMPMSPTVRAKEPVIRQVFIGRGPDVMVTDALERTGRYQHEHRMIRRDGTVIHVFDRGQVVERDGDGHPTRMAGAVSDITDRVHAEHRLRVTTEALIDANISLERKVEERTAELARANTDLQTLALRDALTGLPNRLAGVTHLEAEFARMKRTGAVSTVLMMDVDLFKPINDTHGHGVGDDVLTHIAGLIKGSLRTGDFVARFGGEEFMALLPDTDLDGAVVVAEKIREAVEQSAAPTVGRVTISIGATLASASDPEMDIAVRRADAALYEAKRSGRNRVVVHQQPTA